MRLTATKSGRLSGEAVVPGDKSLSHRALMLGAMAVGTSTITGLLEGEDVLATADALRALGVAIERDSSGQWLVHGVGVGGFAEPDRPLDLGNAGTGVRLLMGLLAGHEFTSFLTGDASLRKRPMGRILAPLEQMGVQAWVRSGQRLPLALRGRVDLLPIVYQSPVASAQIKSAVLFAGLHAPGTTTVIEPHASRDHSERLLRNLGADLTSEVDDSGGNRISLRGQPELRACAMDLPSDPSSAAFPVVAALITPDSEVRLPRIGTNPLRTGLFTTLLDMGGDLHFADPRELAGEPVADLVVRGSALKAVEVPPERAPSMIDEYPILAMAAACAEGVTIMRGLGELRVKESDRLALIDQGLRACGVESWVEGDDLYVRGRSEVAGGAVLNAEHDHRIAMSFLVLGLISEAPIAVDGSETIATSFPGFTALMASLGGQIDSAPGETG